MDKFQPGATVRLKSGSPLMTLGLKDQERMVGLRMV
jgi:uncharacterized protein YodC (DUF2158 family)